MFVAKIKIFVEISRIECNSGFEHVSLTDCNNEKTKTIYSTLLVSSIHQ